MDDNDDDDDDWNSLLFSTLSFFVLLLLLFCLLPSCFLNFEWNFFFKFCLNFYQINSAFKEKGIFNFVCTTYIWILNLLFFAFDWTFLRGTKCEEGKFIYFHSFLYLFLAVFCVLKHLFIRIAMVEIFMREVLQPTKAKKVLENTASQQHIHKMFKYKFNLYCFHVSNWVLLC